MIGRGGVLAVVALFAIACGQATADVPPGPRLAVVVEGPTGTETGTEEGFVLDFALSTVGPAGQAREALIENPAVGRPSWSADGRLLAFGALARRGNRVAVTDTERNTLRIYPRARYEGEPVIAPDGRTVVFARAQLVKVLPGRESYLFKSALWRVDLRTGKVKRLTRWRLQTLIEPGSFSPDGGTLTAAIDDRRGERAVAIDLRSGRFTELAKGASEPVYSPDGTRLAFVRLDPGLRSLPKRDRPVSELMVGNADGSGAKRLLRRRGFISWPSWDPSGSRLAFTHNPPGFTGSLEPEAGNEILAINADGTCLTTVISEPKTTVWGSAWQPGPGREAGPIVCR